MRRGDESAARADPAATAAASTTGVPEAEPRHDEGCHGRSVAARGYGSLVARWPARDDSRTCRRTRRRKAAAPRAAPPATEPTEPTALRASVPGGRLRAYVDDDRSGLL